MIDNTLEYQNDDETINLIGTGRHCAFCNSEEGLPRPIGNYIVKLEPYNHDRSNHKLACQCCRRKVPRAFKRVSNSDKKNHKYSKKKKSIISLF